MIYVLHFEPAFKHARHYVGFAVSERTLRARIEHHLAGRGAKIVAAAVAAGCVVTMTASFEGTRDDERRIKNGGHGPSVCPICREGLRAAKRERDARRVRLTPAQRRLLEKLARGECLIAEIYDSWRVPGAGPGRIERSLAILHDKGLVDWEAADHCFITETGRTLVDRKATDPCNITEAGRAALAP